MRIVIGSNQEFGQDREFGLYCNEFDVLFTKTKS